MGKLPKEVFLFCVVVVVVDKQRQKDEKVVNDDLE